MRFDPGDLEDSNIVERHRRSIAMQQPFTPALNREEAMQVLEALVTALLAARAHNGNR